MDENEETVSPARRTTRSRKVAKTPIVKSPKPKPATRRTRKKVVLMEVEVSDEEEETSQDVDVSEEEKTEKNDKESSEIADRKKSDEAEAKTKSIEKVETNGSGNNVEGAVPDSTEDSVTVVFNDVDMLENIDDSNSREAVEETKTDTEVDKETDEKMEVENIASTESLETNKPVSDVQTKEAKTKLPTKEEPSKVVAAIIAENEKAPTLDELQENSTESDSKATKIKVDELEKEISGKKVEEKNGCKETSIKEVSEDKTESVTKVEEKPAAKVEEKTVAEVEDKIVSEVEEDVVTEVEKTNVEDTKKVVTDEVKTVPKDEEEKTEKSDKVEGKTVVKDDEKTVDEPMNIDEEIKKIQEEENKPKLEEGRKETNDAKVEKNDKLGDTDAENISEDELPVMQAVKVPEAEEVSDEELPGPKRAELPADTEVVSEDELPTVKTEPKKEGTKRKLDATDYDPGSPTSESEAPAKKASLEPSADKDKDEKPKPKKLPELDKYWKAVNDDPTDFTGWTYLLQYVDQENDMEAAREAYDAFLSHYPYCYGYWRKYADYEKRKGNKKKCEEVFERGLKAIPLSVDLWIHYLTYVKSTRAEDEDFIRSQFERALQACGLEFRSDRLWESYVKWETEGKRLRKVTAIYDRLLATPTQSYTAHFDSFQEHIASNPPNKVIEVDEFLALRKEVRHMLKHDVTTGEAADESDAPPGDDDQSKVVSSDEETKSIRERIVSIRRKAHKATVNAVTARWNYEEGIKRPYFHVKPLERCQLKNWQDYLDYETEQGDRVRIIVLFERCLIACALYEEFWLKFVHYLEGLKDPEMHAKIRDVYERACTIHHLKKPSLHLQWAMFEEGVDNAARAAEILVNLEKSVPNVLQIAYRRINLERRRADHEKCAQLYEHYIASSKNKMISSNVAIKYSRFCFRVAKDFDKAREVLKAAIAKDPNNPRLYLQLIDMTLQKTDVNDSEVIEIIDSFLEKETTDVDQKVLFSQRKLEYVEDFGGDVQSVQAAYEQYQKWLKQSKDNSKKKEPKVEAAASSSKKEKTTTPSSSTTNTYSNYGTYGSSSTQPSYPYTGSQQGQNYYPQYGQGDQQYQYQNWQYPQGGYSGYNQWGGYSGGYGY